MKAITTTDLRIRCVLVAIIYGYLVGTLFGFMADGPISPDMARRLTEMPTPAPSSQSSPTAKVYPTIDNWADYNALHDGDFYWSRGHLFKKGIKGRWALDAESNPYPLQPLEPLTSPTPVPSPTPTLFTLPDVPPFIWVLVYVGLIALAIGCLWHMWRWVMGKPKPAPANNPKPPKKKPVVYHDYAQFQAALKINHLEHEAFDRYETARLEVLKKAVKDKTPVGSFVAICAVIAGFYLGYTRGAGWGWGTAIAGLSIAGGIGSLEETYQRHRHAAALVRRTFDVPEPVYEPLRETPHEAPPSPSKTPYDEIKVTSLRQAFEILGLPPGRVTLASAKAAYHTLIAAYHPDKVSHLGPELRELARCKALEINLAM